MPFLEWARYRRRIGHKYLREVLGEFLASFVFGFLVLGCTANTLALNSPTSGTPPNVIAQSFARMPTSVAVGVAFAYFLVTLIFGKVSLEAHVNPAISVAFTIAGKLSWVKLHAYLLAQFLGGYLGNLLGFTLFASYFWRYEFDGVRLQDIEQAAAIFNSAGGVISLGAAFLNEIILTAILTMALLSIKDFVNVNSKKHYIHAILILLTFLALSLAFAQTTGLMVNPMRDICPRLVALTLGYHSDFVLKSQLYKGSRSPWWVAGLFGPFIGATLGSFIYIFLVGPQLEMEEREQENRHNELNWRQTVFMPKISHR